MSTPTWKHVEIALLAIEEWKEERKAENEKIEKQIKAHWIK